MAGSLKPDTTKPQLLHRLQGRGDVRKVPRGQTVVSYACAFTIVSGFLVQRHRRVYVSAQRSGYSLASRS